MDPTNCDRCQASLGRGWSQRYRDDVLLESICFDCDNTEQIDAYEKTKVLTSKVTVMAAIDEVHREYGKPSTVGHRETMIAVAASVERIRGRIKAWERAVWFGGLQAQVLAADFRGFRMDFPGGTALVYSLAGRTQITIETTDESAQVSLITADNEREPVMGQNSIRATEDQAIGLILASQDAFGAGVRFERNDKVGLAF